MVWYGGVAMFHVQVGWIARILISFGRFGFVTLAGMALLGIGAGSPAKYPRRIRFLRAVPVVVALLLRGSLGTRQRAAFAGPVRRAAVFLRGARPVAAIRAWLSRILRPEFLSRPRHHEVDAGSDAGARF